MNQERLGVLAAPRMVRSTFLNARLRYLQQISTERSRKKGAI